MFLILIEELGVHRESLFKVEGLDVDEAVGIDLAVLATDDFDFLVVQADALFDSQKVLLVLNKISLVEKDAVGKRDLLLRFIFDALRFFVIKPLDDVLGIYDSDDSIQTVLLAYEIVNEERLRNGCRVRKTSSLDNDAVEVLDPVMETLQDDNQVTTNCAADTAVHHLDNLLFSALRNNPLVNSDLAELILDDGKTHVVTIVVQDMVEQGGLARAEETGKDSDRNFSHCRPL